MQLRNGIPFWAARNDLHGRYRHLSADARYGVVVLGAGLTGALVAHALAHRGHDVCVLDAGEIGWGSTAACMALMQGHLDIPLLDLAAMHGEDSALAAVRACAAAVDKIVARSRERPATTTSTADRVSLYHATRGFDCAPLRREFEFRRHHGLDDAWLESDALYDRYGLRARCAIISRSAATLDPYRTAHELLDEACRCGAHVHPGTRVVRVRARNRGVDMDTARGSRVQAQHLVVATGPAAQALLPASVGRRRIGCMLVTHPVDSPHFHAIANTLIGETAKPELRIRTTPDGRLMMGIEGDTVHAGESHEMRIMTCARTLLRKMRRRLPDIALEPAFGWVGSCVKTADGLPYFGTHALTGPRIHYAMAYGGNGIPFASIGADSIADSIEGRVHPLATLLGFSRLQKAAA